MQCSRLKRCPASSRRSSSVKFVGSAVQTPFSSSRAASFASFLLYFMRPPCHSLIESACNQLACCGNAFPGNLLRRTLPLCRIRGLVHDVSAITLLGQQAEYAFPVHDASTRRQAVRRARALGGGARRRIAELECHDLLRRHLLEPAAVGATEMQVIRIEQQPAVRHPGGMHDIARDGYMVEHRVAGIEFE